MFLLTKLSLINYGYIVSYALDIRMSGMLDGVCGFGDDIDALFGWVFPTSIAPAPPSTPRWPWFPPFIQSCNG